MGIFDPLFNGLWYAFGLGKKRKKFKQTDPVEFKKTLGKFCIFNVSKINANFIQGGIQGATHQQDDKLDDKGSFWQHTGAAFLQTDGKYRTIEAFAHGIDYGYLENYLNDDFQLEAFSFDINDMMIEVLFNDVTSCIGASYDNWEIFSHIVPAMLAPLFNSKDLSVCSSFWAVIMQKRNLPIVRKKVDAYIATPGDVHDGCYPQRQLKFSPFNF